MKHIQISIPEDSQPTTQTSLFWSIKLQEEQKEHIFLYVTIKISLKYSTSEEAKKLSYKIIGGSLGTLKVL